MARKTIRFSAKLESQIEESARNGGFESPTAFIRAATQRAVNGDQSAALDQAEERILASLESLARDVRSIRRSQQALFAFVDSLVKTMLTCLPEPQGEAHSHAVARGKMRYDRFLKSVGAGLTGNVNGTIEGLNSNGTE